MIRDSFGVGYDAVMAMAVHLSHSSPNLQPLLPFTDSIPNPHGSMAKHFADELRAFYAEAHCAEFFEQVRPMYDSALGRYKTIFDRLDVNWYQRFYGGLRKRPFMWCWVWGMVEVTMDREWYFPEQGRTPNAIEGVDSVDASGNPFFKRGLVPPTGARVQPLLCQLPIRSAPAGAGGGGGSIVRQREDDHGAAGRTPNWQTMENEALVRAAVVRYLMDHTDGGQPPMMELGVQVNRRGFFWLRDLVALLGRYETERTTFPTLESFMPEIVRFYDTLVPDIASYQRRLSDSSIRVVRMGPFQWGIPILPQESGRFLSPLIGPSSRVIFNLALPAKARRSMNS